MALRNTLELRKALFNHLQADATLVALLGSTGKIYHANPQVKPQDYPCLTYQIIADENEPYDATLVTGMSRTTVSIQVFTNVTSSKTADAIEDRVFEILNGARFSTTTVYIVTCFRTERTPVFENDVTLYRINTFYEIVNILK